MKGLRQFLKNALPLDDSRQGWRIVSTLEWLSRIELLLSRAELRLAS